MSDTKEPIKSLRITKEKILVVEGRDEKNFLVALFKNIPQFENVLENIQILPIGGKDKIHEEMKLLVTTPGWGDVESIGIIRDADKNAKSAFDSITQALKNNGLPTPSSPGTFSERSPKTGKKAGIFIMPDGKSQGAIESLCLSTVEEDEKNLGMIKCIDEFMKCNEKLNTDYKKPKNEDKARCRAFLSLMEEDISSLGLAAQKDYWNWKSTRFKPLIEFLEKL